MTFSRLTAPATHALLGGKLFQQRARGALPILVRQALAEQPIIYEALAAELGMPNPRNLNYVLGAISQAMNQLGDANGISIPPIQFVVVRKDSRVPGDAVGWYARGDAAEYGALSRRERRILAQREHALVFAFPHWLAVLDAYDLAPSEVAIPSRVELMPQLSGESEAHRALKERIAREPALVGFKGRPLSTSLEHEFPSRDSVDVLVTGRADRLCIEVKSHEAPQSEIVRGLFQCVKYQALAAAVASIEGNSHEVRTVLALGGKLSAALRPLANTIGVVVVDGLTPGE